MCIRDSSYHCTESFLSHNILNVSIAKLVFSFKNFIRVLELNLVTLLSFFFLRKSRVSLHCRFSYVVDFNSPTLTDNLECNFYFKVTGI